MTIPILASDGRTVLHHAKTEGTARRWLMKNFGDHSLVLINRYRWRLNVWRREPWLVELNGGLDGWMYSIGN